MGEPKNLHFYDCEDFGPVLEPQNQQYLSLETPGHIKYSKKKLKHLSKLLVCIRRFLRQRRAPIKHGDPF